MQIAPQRPPQWFVTYLRGLEPFTFTDSEIDRCYASVADRLALAERQGVRELIAFCSIPQALGWS